MNVYERKQADRRERMLEQADRIREKAAADFRKADLREEVSGIPLGQPILVGHHSERKHRNALERADNAMRRGIEASRYADDLERRATTESHAISSDDPDADDKLAARIATLEAQQTFMREANKIVRAAIKAGVTGPDRSRSRSAWIAPGMCPPDQASAPAFGSVRSNRQSRTSHSGSWRCPIRSAGCSKVENFMGWPRCRRACRQRGRPVDLRRRRSAMQPFCPLLRLSIHEQERSGLPGAADRAHGPRPGRQPVATRDDPRT